jgi:hypothetical protein
VAGKAPWLVVLCLSLRAWGLVVESVSSWPAWVGLSGVQRSAAAGVCLDPCLRCADGSRWHVPDIQCFLFWLVGLGSTLPPSTDVTFYVHVQSRDHLQCW